MKSLTQNQAVVLIVGIVLGVLLGLNLSGARFNTPVHATATQSLDKFAIATGLIDSGVEALFFLDYLTGDLRAAVVDPKTGRFNAFFTHNVALDFGNVGQNPRYLMVTGLADIPRGRGQTQISTCVLYVAEATSGTVAAYAIPWNSTFLAAGRTQTGAFIPLDKRSFRTAFVRDPQ